ncbi:MAG: hypothetical protein J5517_04295 [Eubacterium sp.]|nr:hypothetical protein [Eubacterium sp.]
MDKKLFSFVYNMAFRDATLRNAFKRNQEERDIEFHKRKDRIKLYAEDYVKNYIVQIYADQYPDPYEPIKNICAKCKDDHFTFGNAQKLVNMSAKYMFLSTYGDIEKRKKFKNCHCPMDTIMINVVKRNDKSFKCSIGWSKMELSENDIPVLYKDFQAKVKALCDKEKEPCFPIEYDYLYWDSEEA